MTRSTDDRPPTLDEFAPAVSQCKLCGLDDELREEITSRRLQDPKRFSQALIARYLSQAHKIPVTESSVKRHFANHA